MEPDKVIVHPLYIRFGPERVIQALEKVKAQYEQDIVDFREGINPLLSGICSRLRWQLESIIKSDLVEDPEEEEGGDQIIPLIGIFGQARSWRGIPDVDLLIMNALVENGDLSSNSGLTGHWLPNNIGYLNYRIKLCELLIKMIRDTFCDIYKDPVRGLSNDPSKEEKIRFIWQLINSRAYDAREGLYHKRELDIYELFMFRGQDYIHELTDFIRQEDTPFRLAPLTAFNTTMVVPRDYSNLADWTIGF